MGHRMSKSKRVERQITSEADNLRRALERSDLVSATEKLVANEALSDEETSLMATHSGMVRRILRFKRGETREVVAARALNQKPAKPTKKKVATRPPPERARTVFTPATADERQAFYASREWRELRYKALLRSNGRCECCGRSPKLHGVVLHVDHIKSIFKYPELKLVLENLQVLCADCNLGKGWRDETDWRVPNEHQLNGEYDRDGERFGLGDP